MVGGTHAVAHGQQGGGHPGRAAGALRMPDQALQRGAGQLVGVAVERQLDGARFDAVVQLGGSAVIVDVLHLDGRDARPRPSPGRMARAGSSPHSSRRTRW